MKHNLLHLVGLTFIYLPKMHGYPNIKKISWHIGFICPFGINSEFSGALL